MVSINNHKFFSNTSLIISATLLLSIASFKLQEEALKAVKEKDRNQIVVGASTYIAGNSFGKIDHPASLNYKNDPSNGFEVIQGSDGRWMVLAKNRKDVSTIIDEKPMNSALSDRFKELDVKKKEREDLK